MKPQSKHRQSLLSHAKLRRLNARSEKNTKQPAKWAVGCSVHGLRRNKKGSDEKTVFVGMPRNKREGLRGCPQCAQNQP